MRLKLSLLNRKFSLKLRIIILCLVILGIGGIGNIVMTQGMRKASFRFGNILNAQLPKARAIGEITGAGRRLRMTLRELALAQDETEANQHASTAGRIISEMSDLYARYKTLINDSDEQEHFELSQKTWNRFSALTSGFLEQYKTKKSASKDQWKEYFSKEAAIGADWQLSLDQLSEDEVSDSNKNQTEIEKIVKTVEIVNKVVPILNLALGMLLAFWFTRIVNQAMTKITESLSSGAEDITSMASRISSTSTTISTAAVEQASSLQETASSLEEMTAMMTKTSDNATTSSKASQEGFEAAKLGQDAVLAMMNSMQEIDRATQEILQSIQESNREMDDVVKLINEIESKTKVINDIVFQTKLLSFNASVEAARAGEHGKGFAVVAEEVGKLAELSGNSAHEISTILSGAVQKVHGMVASTKNRIETLSVQSRTKVDTGTEVAKRCSEALASITSSVQNISSRVSEITSASQEQASGIKAVNQAVDQLNQVTQKNSAAASEAEHESQDLFKQAENLRNQIRALRAEIDGGSQAPSNARDSSTTI